MRYPHLVNRYLRGKRSIGRLILVLGIVLMLVVAHQYSLGIGTLAYAAWGPVAWIMWRIRRMILNRRCRRVRERLSENENTIETAKTPRPPRREENSYLKPKQRGRASLKQRLPTPLIQVWLHFLASLGAPLAVQLHFWVFWAMGADLMSQPVVTRFAPSPTGYLHVGGARTALFSWLMARHFGGSFVLRIEDTDLGAGRMRKSVTSLLDDLRWLGLNWDNSELMFQSKRVDIYNSLIEQLISRGLAYKAYETSGVSWKPQRRIDGSGQVGLISTSGRR